MTSDLEKLPAKLSPSRAKDFEQCPKKFYFKTIEKIREPNTAITARGTVAHEALENLYKLPKDQRTPEMAETFIKPAWDEMKTKDNYKHLIPEEGELLDFATECVRNYFTIEDPTRYDPTGLEQYIKATLDDNLTIHGFIDRVDTLNNHAGKDEAVFISDYKTSGKIPQPRYLNDTFYAMKIYALILRETTGVTPHALRLVFIKHTGHKAIKTLQVTDELLDRTKAELQGTWTRIQAAAAAGEWPTKTGPLCDWCYFKNICPAFNNSDNTEETTKQ